MQSIETIVMLKPKPERQMEQASSSQGCALSPSPPDSTKRSIEMLESMHVILGDVTVGNFTQKRYYEELKAEVRVTQHSEDINIYSTLWSVKALKETIGVVCSLQVAKSATYVTSRVLVLM